MTATQEAPAADTGGPAGVAVELMLEEAARRIGLCRAVGGLLGPRSLNATWSLWEAVDCYQHRMATSRTPADMLANARDLLAAVAQLEDSLFTLVIAAAKKGVNP